MRIAALLSVLMIGLGVSTARASFFRTGHPYFLKANQLFLGVEGDGTGLPSAFLGRIELSLDYGINESMMAGAVLPYLVLFGAEDGGTLGDVLIYAKFVLYQPTDLSWRLVLELPIRFPTGVIPADAGRRVNGTAVSYYPFATGSAGVFPAVQGAFFFGGWMAALRASYISENQPSENILNFNALQDRLEFQASADYQWRFDVAPGFTLFERPSLSLSYLLNLSASPAVADHLLLSLETT